MRKYYLLIVAGLLSLGMLMTSCTKEGPEGPAGKDGINGTNGINGTDGEDGNANVQEVDFTVDLADFDLWSTNNSYYVYKSLSYSSGDAVLGYVYANSEWNPMSFIKYFNTSNYFNVYSFSLSDDDAGIFIYIRNSEGGQPYSDMTTGSLSYKFIVINAATYATMPHSIDLDDYSTVKSYFNLKN